MRISDWSSDVCSSDLPDEQPAHAAASATAETAAPATEIADIVTGIIIVEAHARLSSERIVVSRRCGSSLRRWEEAMERSRGVAMGAFVVHRAGLQRHQAQGSTETIAAPRHLRPITASPPHRPLSAGRHRAALLY